MWPPPIIDGSSDVSCESSPTSGHGVQSSQPESPGIRQGQPAPHAQYPALRTGSWLAERYRVGSLLGQGPMGATYAGDCQITGKLVAIKTLSRPPAMTAEHFAWQVRQALALAYFDHPHACAMNDFGALDFGNVFLVRPLQAGVSLRRLLASARLDVSRSLRIAYQITTALRDAHARDVTHGRLKPENVIVTEDPSRGEHATMVDFGLAEFAQGRTSDPYQTQGGRWPSAEADVFSLGALLFEMLEGRPRRNFETPPEPHFPPRVSATELPPRLRKLLQNLLQPGAPGMPATDLLRSLATLIAQPPPAPRATSAPPEVDDEAVTVSLRAIEASASDVTEPQVWTGPPPSLADFTDTSSVVGHLRPSLFERVKRLFRSKKPWYGGS